MYLVIENLPADTKVTDIAAFLEAKGWTDYERIDVSGTENLVATVHCCLSHAELHAVAQCLNQAYWKGRALQVSCTTIFS